MAAKTKSANGTKTNVAKEKLLIQPIKKQRFRFWIKGVTPLIQSAWSDEALAGLRLTPNERKKVPKVARDPEKEALGRMYWTEDGKNGIPAMAFKAALVEAAHKDLGLEKTLLRKALFIVCHDPNMILPIEADKPTIREDVVRVGQSGTDLRYRPEFKNWRVKVECEIDRQLLTPQDILNLTDRAGFGVGIGEWRPEKGSGGIYGRFQVDSKGIEIDEPIES